MVNRIVKMTFRNDAIEQFTEIFNTYQDRIRAAKGCRSVQLLHDVNNPCIFFTYSIWDDETFLETYRLSSTFGEVWPQVKPLFAAPAEAWTTIVEG
jgi:quinol monooxygenase YgiN